MEQLLFWIFPFRSSAVNAKSHIYIDNITQKFSLQAGETRRKHEIHDLIERGLAVAESERAKATLVSHHPPPPSPLRDGIFTPVPCNAEGHRCCTLLCMSHIQPA